MASCVCFSYLEVMSLGFIRGITPFISRSVVHCRLVATFSLHVAVAELQTKKIVSKVLYLNDI